ncbi:MAG TPA: molybdopterin-binding/glycosyltransferase family 2 protein [Alphaproteobacteria bacterium]
MLAHSIAAGKLRFRKGHKLSAADIAALRAGGVESAIVAVLGTDDVPENDAALKLARALAGSLLRAGNAGTGRCNLYPDRAGLFVVDAEEVHRFNGVDEAITLSTVAPFAPVAPGHIAATVKIIPFAAPRAAVDRCLEIARRPLLRVAPFRALRVALVQTRLPGLKPALLKKTVAVTRAKLAEMGSELVADALCEHEEAGVAAAIAAAAKRKADVVLVLGASAIVDRRDVIPSAIESLGGTLVHFGMPVDPGNLTLLARLGDRLGGGHVIGLPGSARSPRRHGSDYVLLRLAAGIEVSASDIARMGVGGLLKEIPSRPMPRARAAPAPAALPRIAGIVLAAGRSTRMRGPNKLLSDIDGAPLVRRVADAVTNAGLAETVVVTGHEREKVESALAGLPLRFAVNRKFADGLSTSLKTGIAALGPGIDGALVCLGDMPGIGPALVARLVGAFAPERGKDIVVPVRGGRRGNPVLIGRRHFAAIKKLTGDVGARALIQAHADAVIEVEVGDDAAFVDLDTPEALADYRARVAAGSDCGRH